MSQIFQLKEELKETKTVEFITNVFTEVNAIKASNIRSGFESNRRFYEEITAIYHSIKLSETALLKDLSGRKESLKTLTMAITSNLRFYGNLNTDVMEKFVADAAKKKVEGPDLMVIGQTGLDYLAARKIDLRFQPLRFKKDYPDFGEVNFLVEQARGYDRVYIYYPKFINMVSQKVAVIDITQTADLKEMTTGRAEDQPAKAPRIDIFEPELSKIIEFFEDQVKTLLLIRTFLETELSRTAARLLSMSGASQRAEELLRQQKVQLNKAKNSLENAKILETFAGMKNWGGVGR